MSLFLRIVTNRIELLSTESGAMLVRIVENNVEKLESVSGSVTLSITASDPTPTSLLINRSEVSAGVLQTWTLRYKRWNALDWTVFADDLTDLSVTVTGLLPYDPDTDPDPLVTPLYSFEAVASVLVDSAPAVAYGSTTEEPPPPLRSPEHRYIWSAGATQGANNYGPSGGETYSTVRMTFRNVTGGDLTKISAGFLTGKVPGGTISKLFYSPDGNVWTPVLFDGVAAYTEAGSIPGGSDQSSLVKFSDYLILPAPVAPNGIIQFSIVTPASGPAALPLTQFTTGVTGFVAGFAYRKNGDFGDQVGWAGFDEITYGPFASFVMEYSP